MRSPELAPRKLMVDVGWLYCRLGAIGIWYVEPAMDDASFERYLAAMARDIDERPRGLGLGCIYHVPEAVTMTATRRKAVSDVLESRSELVLSTTRAYAMATSSLLVRGVVRAVFWLAPPGYPHAVTETMREALFFVASHLPGSDGDALDRAYVRTLAEHAPQGRVLVR